MSNPIKTKRQKRLERDIKSHLNNYSVSQWLRAIVHLQAAKPIEQAAATYFAMLYARLDNPTAELPTSVVTTKTAERLVKACTQFRLADPISNRRIARTGAWAVIRRVAASQLHYDFDPIHAFARAYCLWVVLGPKVSVSKNKTFDFESEFLAVYGVSAQNWLKIAMTILAASSSRRTLTRDYFEVARRDGIDVPNDEVVLTALATLAATPKQFRQHAAECFRPNRAYFAYDRDPLVQYPICRLWEPELSAPQNDKLALPVPNLLAHRVTSGVKDSLRRQFGDRFSSYFGDLFSTYIGELLNNCRDDLIIYTESALGRIVGPLIKRPDWVLSGPNCTISFECKAAKLDPSVEMTGDLTDSTVKRHIQKAAMQFGEFEVALPRSHELAISKRWRIIVTWDDLYIGRDELSRHFGLEMYALPISKVEVLIGLLELGEDPASLMEEIDQKGINIALDDASQRSGYCHGKTWLSRYSARIFESLGVEAHSGPD